ncbi:hypothetical protein FA10DRAFT_296964 [Acaromyces ingoldii]|uniref:Uncharacterized protein n=1 Tax=Acaromyces ingoldii TaxID=215250 RepID=A0A316YHZ4_9BASI|nr:hypothetical protein FA10DRAFT_296964 [Acaromyces ingoldii]PWN87335.1 hypothetical protein FA10DRAFT_296964 [Acaromyces ingoldii]
MHSHSLLMVVLSVWFSLLLLASSCQNKPLDLGQNGCMHPAPSSLQSFVQEVGRRSFDDDSYGSKTQYDDLIQLERVEEKKREFSGTPRTMRKTSGSDQRADTSDSFFKREETDSERVGTVELTQTWSHLQELLNHREQIAATRERHWDSDKDTYELIDEMLGPLSSGPGDHFSGMIFIGVPQDEIKVHAKQLNSAFRGRPLCGWLKAQVLSDEDTLKLIRVLRYEPEGGWPIFRRAKRRRNLPGTTSSPADQVNNDVDAAKVVKFNWVLLSWPRDDEEFAKHPWIIREQWYSRPEGNTELVFFNVPLNKEARVRRFIDTRWGPFNAKPEVQVLPDENDESDKCRLSLHREDDGVRLWK